MDYKKFIESLRAEAMFQRSRFSRDIIASELESATTAIETLLAERDAAVNSLAAYEDTGLSPETVSDLLERFNYFYRTVEGLDIVDPVHFGAFVDRVKRWQQAEKDGRLVVLPVKEGTTIYRVRLNFDGDRYEIIEMNFDLARFRPEDFGRIVFQTREEAEAALKKREAKQVDTD